jgi:NH3-dependent NAD+ synthetase
MISHAPDLVRNPPTPELWKNESMQEDTTCDNQHHEN